MTNTLRMSLKKALDDGDYIEFLSIIYENNLWVDQNGRIGESYDFLDNCFEKDLRDIPVCDFLWCVFEFIGTTFDRSDRQLPVAYISVTTDDSSTSVSSMDFVEL